MAKQSINIDCGGCGKNFTITSKTIESVMVCPFCADEVALAYDDIEDIDEALEDEFGDEYASDEPEDE